MFWWSYFGKQRPPISRDGEEKRERHCKLILPCIASTAPKSRPYSLIHVLIGQAASNSLLSIPSAPPPPSLPLSLHAARQWMSPVRHKLFNGTASLALTLSSSLALFLSFPLSGADSQWSVRHWSDTGLTEDRRRRQTSLTAVQHLEHLQQSINCTTLQIKAEATDCPQVQLLLQLMLSQLIWVPKKRSSFATAPAAVISRGLKVCLSVWKKAFAQSKHKEMTTLSNRNEKLWFSREATRFELGASIISTTSVLPSSFPQRDPKKKTTRRPSCECASRTMSDWHAECRVEGVSLRFYQQEPDHNKCIRLSPGLLRTKRDEEEDVRQLLHENGSTPRIQKLEQKQEDRSAAHRHSLLFTLIHR